MPGQPGSEQGIDSSTPSSEQENDFSEYDFCGDCDDYLDHEDMASGLCRSCRSVGSSSDEVLTAKQDAPTERVPVTDTSGLAVCSTERVPVTGTSSLTVRSTIATTPKLSKMDDTPQETAVISTAAICPVSAATPESSQMDDIPQVEKASEIGVLANTAQNASEVSIETEDAEKAITQAEYQKVQESECSYNEQIAKDYENAKKYPVNTDAISGIWALVRNKKLTSALTKPMEHGSVPDCEVSMDCHISSHEDAASTMVKAAPLASFGLRLKIQQIYFDQPQQAQCNASKCADTAPKCCNICQEPLEKHEKFTCEWCEGIPVCYCVEQVCCWRVECLEICYWSPKLRVGAEEVEGLGLNRS